MSDINGNGYGDAHDWERVYTHQWGYWGGAARSDYKCRNCHELFSHHYHAIKDIFDAMKHENIKEICEHE